MALFQIHLATPPGEGGIAVVELYGEGAAGALRSCFRTRTGGLPASGQSRYGELLDAEGEVVDDGVLARLPAAGMWSRLEAWSLSIHGGVWIQERAMEVLGALGGESLSTAEILCLAVRSGAMDAIQARAYSCMLEALTLKTARFFVRQYEGELSREILRALEGLSVETLRSTRSTLRGLLERGRIAERAARPLRVLIAGPPNSGKSTLFNRLVEDERAVVSPVPGTTRDRIEECIELDGFPIVLSDSAGLRSHGELSEIERVGISGVRPEDWDALLYLVPYPWRPSTEDISFLQRVEPHRRLVLASLADRAAPGEEPAPEPLAPVRIAALQGHGLDRLKREMLARWVCFGSDPSAEIPCGPFDPSQSTILGAALATEGDPHAILDAIRSAYIECLRSSWI